MIKLERLIVMAARVIAEARYGQYDQDIAEERIGDALLGAIEGASRAGDDAGLYPYLCYTFAWCAGNTRRGAERERRWAELELTLTDATGSFWDGPQEEWLDEFVSVRPWGVEPGFVTREGRVLGVHDFALEALDILQANEDQLFLNDEFRLIVHHARTCASVTDWWRDAPGPIDREPPWEPEEISTATTFTDMKTGERWTETLVETPPTGGLFAGEKTLWTQEPYSHDLEEQFYTESARVRGGDPAQDNVPTKKFEEHLLPITRAFQKAWNEWLEFPEVDLSFWTQFGEWVEIIMTRPQLWRYLLLKGVFERGPRNKFQRNALSFATQGDYDLYRAVNKLFLQLEDLYIDEGSRRALVSYLVRRVTENEDKARELYSCLNVGLAANIGGNWTPQEGSQHKARYNALKEWLRKQVAEGRLWAGQAVRLLSYLDGVEPKVAKQIGRDAYLPTTGDRELDLLLVSLVYPGFYHPRRIRLFVSKDLPGEKLLAIIGIDNLQKVELVSEGYLSGTGEFAKANNIPYTFRFHSITNHNYVTHAVIIHNTGLAARLRARGIKVALV